MNPPRRAHIAFEVRPSSSTSGVYRIYVNDTLITERTCKLSPEYAIKENIEVVVPLGRHKFKLVPVNCSLDHFTIHHFVLGKNLLHIQCKSLEFDFAVDASLPAVV
jgi:hypothetical protein